MSGKDNPGFQTDGGDENNTGGGGGGLQNGSMVLPLEDMNGKYSDPLNRVVVGAEQEYPPEGEFGKRSSSYQVSLVSSDLDPAPPPPPVDGEQYEEEDDDEDYSLLSLLPCHQAIRDKIDGVKQFQGIGSSKLWWRRLGLSVLAALYTAYFIAVLVIHRELQSGNTYWCHGDGLLILITLIVVVGLLYFQVVKPVWGSHLYDKVLKPVQAGAGRAWSHRPVRWLVCVGLLLAVAVFLIVDAWQEPHRLVSIFGVFVLLLFGFVFSTAPRKVRWRQVAWGMGLQFVFGLIILRWPLGKAVFECAGNKTATFLAFTDEGSGFVFGTLVTDSNVFIFAFKVLSVILFFSFCIQILYYWGVMQWVVIKLGWFLQVTVGTTACESVNAAANIFLGQTEAPLLIKPYIPMMTKSELHAVMTGGFATIAGSVMAAYIAFEVDPSHLLSASVMSAPAALAFAKLFYPETKQSRTGVKDIKIVKGDEANWLHAAMVGVTNAIPLVANIAANLIAFYAFIALCSTVFDWTCTLAGAEEGVCSLENLFGWIFMPLAWVMGVDWSECDKVGELIGLKTIVNEFVAYQKLSEMKKANLISKRAEIISTYALCGFSNISSIGINLGGFSAMAPSRRADLARVVVRAMIAGSCACFLTACIAGTLLSEFDGASVIDTTNSNFTR